MCTPTKKKKIKNIFQTFQGKNLAGEGLPRADCAISCGCALQKMLGAGGLLGQDALPAVHSTQRSLSSSGPEPGQREL